MPTIQGANVKNTSFGPVAITASLLRSIGVCAAKEGAVDGSCVSGWKENAAGSVAVRFGCGATLHAESVAVREGSPININVVRTINGKLNKATVCTA